MDNCEQDTPKVTVSMLKLRSPGARTQTLNVGIETKVLALKTELKTRKHCFIGSCIDMKFWHLRRL